MYDVAGLIKKYTKYAPVRDNPYTFSASMFGNTLLQNYLIVVNGNAEEGEISDATLGSVFHIGLEQMINAEPIGGDGTVLVGEETKTYRMDNGWTVSGTTDLSVYRDGNLVEIHDYKLVKQYKIKTLDTAMKATNDPYGKQLNINAFIRRNMIDPRNEPELWLQMFSKNADAMESERTYNPIRVRNEDPMLIHSQLIAKTDEIRQWIESGQVPPECSNEEKWIRKHKRTGVVMPTRCMFYCSQGRSGMCPYYKPSVFNRLNPSQVRW